MIRPFSLRLFATVALCASALHAQSKLRDQLSRVDLGVQAVGQFTGTVSGVPTVQSPVGNQVVSISPSTTIGGLITVRYSRKPYLGGEFNGGFARYSEDYNVRPYTIQTQATEYTLGYLVVPPYTVFGLKPYASAGVGGMRFTPTRGGGNGAPPIGRFAIYYSLGVQKDLIPHVFGLRAGFRQVIFAAPDFYQNYLTLQKHTSTSEPMVGLYLRF